MNPLDYFGRPAFLMLLILLPVIWVFSFDSLAGLGRWRRIFALILRSLVLTLLVFVLAQAQWPKTADRMTVIYLLDQSSSIPQAQREYMLDYVYHAVSNHRRENRKDMAGVIVFVGNAKIEAAPFDGEIPLIGRIESGHDLQTDATSLESAFKLAKASFPEDSARRVVVVSDGNENLGDGLSLAQALAEDGIGIDVVPVKLAVSVPITGGPGGIAGHAVIVLAGLQYAYDIEDVESAVEIGITIRSVFYVLDPHVEVLLVHTAIAVQVEHLVQP